MEKRSRIEERENVRRDTEGGEKVRDTGGFITLPEIRRVSTQTVWQTKPRRRSEINQQHPTTPLTFFVCKDYCGFLDIFEISQTQILCFGEAQTAHGEFLIRA